MFGGKIASPVNFILELQFLLFVFNVSFEDFDCFGVGYSVESCINNMLKSCFESFLHVLFKEIHIVSVVLYNVLKTEFNVVLSACHIVFNCGKNDFRFNHPKFAKMSSSMRVFSSESWSKGVAISQTYSEGFNVKLTTNTKESCFTEHILFIINFLLFKWNWGKVKEITFFWFFFLLLLFFFTFLWFFASSEIFGCFLFFSFFLLLFFKCFSISNFLKFSFALWSLGMSLKSCHFADWLVRMR